MRPELCSLLLGVTLACADKNDGVTPAPGSSGGVAGDGAAGVGGTAMPGGAGAGGEPLAGGAGGGAAGQDHSGGGVVAAGGSTGSAGAAGAPPADAGAGGAAGQGAEGGAGAVGSAGASSGAAGTAGDASTGGAGGSAGSSGAGSAGGGAGAAGAAGGSSGPAVDRSNPRLHQLQFAPNAADSSATRALGKQFAYLDTRVEPKGKLVLYLHGAGDFANCGNGALGTLVASYGYHWFGPCYLSNYGVDNCGSDIEGCRLEALEGTDHHPFVQIARPDSIEERVVRGLEHLQTLDPEGDWQYFVDGDAPRWSDIVVTGHSHGASTSGVIGVHRSVHRVVMLAGPYDPGQAWLSSTPLTPVERFFGFSHTGDSQYQGHLAAWESLDVPGMPTRADGGEPPYGDSHRLYTSIGTGDAHGSVTAGNISELIPAWRYLYDGD